MDQTLLTLRGHFVQADLVNQGLVRRLGRGRLHSVFPVDDDRVIIITDGGAALIDLPTSENFWEIDNPAQCGALHVESQLLALGDNNKITVWDLCTGVEKLKITTLERDLKTGKLRHQPDGYGAISIAFSPDGKRVISCDYNDICLWEASGGHEVWRLPKQDARMVIFSPDGRLIASAGEKDKRVVLLWDALHGSEVRRFQGHTEDGIQGLAFSPNGRWIASSGSDGLIRLWEVASGREIYRFACNKYGRGHIAFSPDGNFLATGSGPNGSVCIWSFASGSQMREFAISSDLVSFSPTGHILVTGDHNGAVRRWEIKSGHEQGKYTWNVSDTKTLAFGADGRILAACSENVITLWAHTTGKVIKNLETERRVKDLVFSPDGHWLAALLDLGRTIYVWETGTWERQAVLHTPSVSSIKQPKNADAKDYLPTTSRFRRSSDTALSGDIHGERLMFHIDGHHLALIGGTRHGSIWWALSIPVWDVATWTEQTWLKLPENLAGSKTPWNLAENAVLSQNWRYLVCSAGDDAVIWDLTTGEEVRRLAGVGLKFILSQNFRLLASTDKSRDKTLPFRVWDFISGREVSENSLSRETLWSVHELVGFVPDGRTIATVQGYNGLALWDCPGLASNPRLVRDLPDVGRIAAFHPDGHLVASSSHAGIIRLWNLSELTLLGFR